MIDHFQTVWMMHEPIWDKANGVQGRQLSSFLIVLPIAMMRS
jgi:hypothetical protein